MDFQNYPHPIIFAHRGASASAPENTLAAFEQAIKQMADFIELDVTLSADGQVMVIHDDTVDRTTSGHGRVDKFTLTELKLLDAGSYFDTAFHDEHIPTLEEVFRQVGERIQINVELKSIPALNNPLPDRVANLVRQCNLEKRVIFSSFDPIILVRIHNLLPEVPIGLLADEGISGALTRRLLSRFIPHQALHPSYKDVTPELIQQVHQSQRRLHTWTVDGADDLRKMMQMGVDGVITNDPVLARQVRDTLYSAGVLSALARSTQQVTS